MGTTYKALQTVTVGAGGASSIDFTNIPQTYTDLVLKISARTSASGNVIDLRIRAGNGSVDTGSNYSYVELTAIPSAAIVAGGAGTTDRFNTIHPGSSATASMFGSVDVYIPSYTSSNKKSMSTDAVTENNSSNVQLRLQGWLWSGTSAINTISIYPASGTLDQYSTATLYGVYNVDVTTAPAAPTIGTATAGIGSASVAFTGVSGASLYTATSTPGSITGTGTTSPITVSGLTNGTAYTFKVKASNPIGTGPESAASNSVTPSAAAFESIASTVVGAGGASEVTFSGISSSYTHLQLRFYAPNLPQVSNSLCMRVGNAGISASSYTFHGLFGYANGAVGAVTRPNESQIEIHYLPAGTTTPVVGVVDILDFANTNKNKTVRSLTGHDDNSSSNSGQVWFVSGAWLSNSAITDVRLYHSSGNLPQYTRVSLYGIKVVP